MPARLLIEIDVDHECRILPFPIESKQEHAAMARRKLHPRNDADVCHVERQIESKHEEKVVRDGVELRSKVMVREQEYVLVNFEQDLAVFVVEQPVPKDWTIDSDPRPVKEVEATVNRQAGTLATFRVYAKPGETVRLHVGMRRVKTKEKKLKTVAAS